MPRTLDSSPTQMIAAAGRLKTAMKKEKITPTLLSHSTGISLSTIYHFLHGRREMHLDDLTAIGSVLQVHPSWIAWG